MRSNSVKEVSQGDSNGGEPLFPKQNGLMSLLSIFLIFLFLAQYDFAAISVILFIFSISSKLWGHFIFLFFLSPKHQGDPSRL